ncbi:MAG: hypothetical protein ACOCZJ_02420 [Thermoplasmatota archaeon]
MNMLPKFQKKEIINKISEKFKNLPDEMEGNNYFDDYDNKKDLVLDVAIDCIKSDPHIIFAELNERKQLEIAPTPELIAKHGEEGAGVIAKKRAKSHIKKVTDLIREILDNSDELQENIEKEETEPSSSKKQERHNKKVGSSKYKLKMLNKDGSIIYKEILREILEFARDSEEFTTSDLLPRLEEEFGGEYSPGTLRNYALKTLRYCQKKNWISQLDKRKRGAYLFKGKNVEKGLAEIKKD